MEEIITALGNFGSSSGCVPVVLGVVVVLGMTDFAPSSGKEGSEVPLGFVSWRHCCCVCTGLGRVFLLLQEVEAGDKSLSLWLSHSQMSL